MKIIETKFAEAFYESLVRGITGISPDVLQLMEEALAEEKSPSGQGHARSYAEECAACSEAEKRGMSVPRNSLHLCAMWYGPSGNRCPKNYRGINHPGYPRRLPSSQHCPSADPQKYRG
jgi:hypothetical protein